MNFIGVNIKRRILDEIFFQTLGKREEKKFKNQTQSCCHRQNHSKTQKQM